MTYYVSSGTLNPTHSLAMLHMGCKVFSARRGRRQEFSFGEGAAPQGVCGLSPPVATQFADIVYRFRLQKRSKLENF